MRRLDHLKKLRRTSQCWFPLEFPGEKSWKIRNTGKKAKEGGKIGGNRVASLESSKLITLIHSEKEREEGKRKGWARTILIKALCSHFQQVCVFLNGQSFMMKNH